MATDGERCAGRIFDNQQSKKQNFGNHNIINENRAPELGDKLGHPKLDANNQDA